VSSREQNGGREAEEMSLAMFSFAALNPSTSTSSSSGGVLGAISTVGSAIMPPFMTPSFRSGTGAVAANAPSVPKVASPAPVAPKLAAPMA
jgi:hypothetical protein